MSATLQFTNVPPPGLPRPTARRPGDGGDREGGAPGGGPPAPPAPIPPAAPLGGAAGVTMGGAGVTARNNTNYNSITITSPTGPIVFHQGGAATTIANVINFTTFTVDTGQTFITANIVNDLAGGAGVRNFNPVPGGMFPTILLQTPSGNATFYQAILPLPMGGPGPGAGGGGGRGTQPPPQPPRPGNPFSQNFGGPRNGPDGLGTGYGLANGGGNVSRPPRTA